MHGSSEDQSPAGEIRSEPGPSGLLQVLQLSRSSTPQGSGFLAEANPYPLALNEPKQVASGNPQSNAEETELVGHTRFLHFHLMEFFQQEYITSAVSQSQVRVTNCSLVEQLLPLYRVPL